MTAAPSLALRRHPRSLPNHPFTRRRGSRNIMLTTAAAVALCYAGAVLYLFACSRPPAPGAPGAGPVPPVPRSDLAERYARLERERGRDGATPRGKASGGGCGQFEQRFERHLQRKSGTFHDLSSYGTILSNLLSVLGPDRASNVLVVRTERLSTDGRGVAGAVMELIGAGKSGRKMYEAGLHKNAHPGGKDYCRPSEKLAREGREIFRDDVALLEQLVGKKFRWGGDDGGDGAWTTARVEGWNGAVDQLRPSKAAATPSAPERPRKDLEAAHEHHEKQCNGQTPYTPCVRPVYFWGGGKAGSTTLAALLKHGAGGTEYDPESPFADLGKEFCWAMCQRHDASDWAQVAAKQPVCSKGGGTRFLLDACPRYTSIKHAKRILADYPDAKFIMLVREPVERLVSQINDSRDPRRDSRHLAPSPRRRNVRAGI